MLHLILGSCRERAFQQFMTAACEGMESVVHGYDVQLYTTAAGPERGLGCIACIRTEVHVTGAAEGD